ncbi:hypothetical protein MPTK1_5g21070 [Marchantia polymorpha subsp. ruderalis]|uniref:Uncharacterized protein n=1 Tax=Marchantia polymorpha subsp. ruderalis TaxID=1480154 RepID=A0AAF6BKM1_MARPO|nr:hypothetical protein Mp_5g21070 [Marchantia polymorpha subsp. ruderalis]
MYVGTIDDTQTSFCMRCRLPHPHSTWNRQVNSSQVKIFEISEGDNLVAFMSSSFSALSTTFSINCRTSSCSQPCGSTPKALERTSVRSSMLYLWVSSSFVYLPKHVININ